nr:uncharacterized protein LOC124499664 [Dermatophagoides farinae]
MNHDERPMLFLGKIFDFIKWKFNSLQKNINDVREKRQLLKKMNDEFDKKIIEAHLIGMTDDELATIFDKHFHHHHHHHLNHSFKFLQRKSFIIWLSFILLLISFLLTSNTCKRYGMRFGRKILFQLENHWNWLDVYYDRCLLSSSSNIRTSSTTAVKKSNERCDYCENVNQIIKINGNSYDQQQQQQRRLLHDQITSFITQKLPFIYHDEHFVTNEIRSWPIRKNFTRIIDFKRLYNETNHHHNYGICMFRSNLVNVNDPYEFFNEIDDDDDDGHSYIHHMPWFIHWQNCGLKEMKKIRHLYKRLSILPPMIEMSKPNWLLLSSSETINQRTFKPIIPSQQTDIMVIIQIQGHIEFDLHTAIDDCQYICQQQKNNSTYKRIYYYLPANHLVVIDPKYWRFSYRPPSSSSSSSIKEDIKNMDYIDTTMNLSLILTGIIV